MSLVGAGGMGEVYKARDARLDRDVAVKVLPAHLTESPLARERFQREARAVAALQHPNICTIHDVGETGDGQAFLVMELLQGETLEHGLTRGPLDATQLIDTGIALADAIEVAHAAGIMHRDIKPANIFLTARGPKILDFGLAKPTTRPAATVSMQDTIAASPLVTDPGSTVGTVAYMSPEQLRGEAIDARTDLFSFGLVLYEMATGKPAFPGPTSAVIAAAILHEEPVAPCTVRPELPEQLDVIILKAIDKDRGLRYQHASDMRTDLQRLKRDSAQVRTSVSPRPPVQPVMVARWRIVVPSVAAALIALSVGYVYLHRTPRLTDKDTIVLADFTNTTGDAVFDETLRQGLAVHLAQSPFLSLVSEARISKTLGLMGQAADAPLTPALAQDICERTGSAAVLEGSIAGLGSEYVVGLTAKNCRNGEELVQEQVQAARKEDVLNALSSIADRFRTRVGESLATVERHSTPLAEATTPSLEALKAYSTALKVNISTGAAAALPLFKRAVEIDPQFALARALLGLTYGNLGESALSVENTTKAYQARGRASESERFFITALYDRGVTGNLEKAQQTFRSWAQSYPRDEIPHGLLSGFALQGTGRYEESIEEATKAIELDPDDAYSYVNVAFSCLYLGRLVDAENAVQRAAVRKLEIPESFFLRYYIALLRGDQAGMDREVELVKGKAGAEDLMSHSQSLVLARSGQLQRARDMSRRAVEGARQAGQRERAAAYMSGVAVWEAFAGNPVAATRSATQAIELSTGRDVEYGAAFAFARAGEMSRAQVLANDLDTRFPEDTTVRFNYLPALAGLFALNAHEPARAIEQLQPAVAYEFGVSGISFFGFFGALHPTFVRGEAYLAAHQGAEAAAEFQKILDHRGLVLGDPMDGVARLQLGRAFAMSGETIKAKAAYQDFLALWKDANADIPVLTQAKAEYAKLK